MVEMSKDEKKALAKAATDFNLHVLLVMRQDGLSKAQAQARAYDEGVDGLNAKRLGQPL